MNTHIVAMNRIVQQKANVQKDELDECKNLGLALSQITEQWNDINPDKNSQPDYILQICKFF